MVVEQLTFRVDLADQPRWLAVEERTWSRFLEQQPGFVGKQMWTEDGDEDHVHAVIWWESMAHWKAVDEAAARAVDETMGRWLRPPTCRAFHVVREH